MINLIVDVIGEKVKQMCFVEKWGGLTRNAAKAIVDEDGNILGSEIWPISCEVSPEDCFEIDDKHKKIRPMPGVKSVFWVKQGGTYRQFKQNNINPGRNDIYGRFSFDMVGWINLKEIGIEDCRFAHKLYAQFSKDFLGVFEPIVVWGDPATQIIWGDPNNSEAWGDPGNQMQELGKAQITIDAIHMDDKGHKETFSPYVFADNLELFIYPYDYFCLTFEGTFKLRRGCIEDLFCGDPIDC